MENPTTIIKGSRYTMLADFNQIPEGECVKVTWVTPTTADVTWGGDVESDETLPLYYLTGCGYIVGSTDGETVYGSGVTTDEAINDAAYWYGGVGQPPMSTVIPAHLDLLTWVDSNGTTPFVIGDDGLARPKFNQ
jgi:hypothetical protein